MHGFHLRKRVSGRVNPKFKRRMLFLDLRFSLLHKHFVDQILLTFVKGHPSLHAFLEEELSVVILGHFLLFPLDTDPQG